MRKKIAIVIPSYNEEGNIEIMANSIKDTMQALPYDYEVIFVDDGSSDATLEKLKALSTSYSNLFFVELSRNFGHQNALKAGVDIAKANAVITMDGDMQHPPELIPELLKKWEEGYDVVYTRREDDKNNSYFKRKTSKGFYKVFTDFTENELFIRGLVSWLGFKQFAIDYAPAERFSGKSKYTMKKMMRFAIQGITSFSTRPLHLAIFLGIGLSLFAFVFYIGYVIYSIYFGHVISGWASVISTIVFFGGLNLIVLGIIGMYIGKLFIQSKQRPNYLIRSTNYK
jgi:dolichol-phosphate mannosyltransferase